MKSLREMNTLFKAILHVSAKKTAVLWSKSKLLLKKFLNTKKYLDHDLNRTLFTSELGFTFLYIFFEM